MKVWIFQTGEPLHSDAGSPRPMRAMNLANALVARGHEVVIWSSSFYHQEKRHRVIGSNTVRVSNSLEIRLVDSPGYQRNIGPARLWDHAVLARNLFKKLDAETVLPDVAFIGYPPIETAVVMTRWLSSRRVPCMVDVKDQWPIIFIDALPAVLKPFGRVALTPYFYYSRRALSEATAISAMADGFLQWAAGFAGRAVGKLDRVVPLTTPTGQITVAKLQEAGSWWDQLGIHADGTQRICFIGSHSKAFDMEPVMQAAKSMAAAGNPCQFVFCGGGESSVAWQEMASGLPNVFFPGWIDRARVEVLARRSCAALAPYHNSPDFVLSIPNKVIDSLSLGLPILSPLCGEVRRLISEFDVGISYGPMVKKTLENCIEDLGALPDLRKKLSYNALNLYREHFSFETVYGGLANHLELLVQHNKRV